MKKENCETLENPMYHDTWILLKKYRDVVWSLELSVQRVRRQFQIEYGSSIEEFLESIYLAGVDFADSGIEEHAQSIERSHKMLKLVESSVELLRNKHKHGEDYYWLLYYSFLSPQQYRSAEEIIEQLKPHIRDISYRTYYRKRKEAIDALKAPTARRASCRPKKFRRCWIWYRMYESIREPFSESWTERPYVCHWKHGLMPISPYSAPAAA